MGDGTAVLDAKTEAKTLVPTGDTPPPAPARAPRAREQRGPQKPQRTALIVRDAVVRSPLTSRDDLRVCGRVEASVATIADVTVERTGVVLADVHARTAIILGWVRGDVRASERVEVGAGAIVDGDIVAPSVILADGARVRGTVAVQDAPRRGATAAPVPPVSTAIRQTMTPWSPGARPPPVSPSIRRTVTPSFPPAKHQDPT